METEQGEGPSTGTETGAGTAIGPYTYQWADFRDSPGAIKAQEEHIAGCRCCKEKLGLVNDEEEVEEGGRIDVKALTATVLGELRVAFNTKGDGEAAAACGVAAEPAAAVLATSVVLITAACEALLVLNPPPPPRKLKSQKQPSKGGGGAAAGVGGGEEAAGDEENLTEKQRKKTRQQRQETSNRSRKEGWGRGQNTPERKVDYGHMILALETAVGELMAVSDGPGPPAAMNAAKATATGVVGISSAESKAEKGVEATPEEEEATQVANAIIAVGGDALMGAGSSGGGGGRHLAVLFEACREKNLVKALGITGTRDRRAIRCALRAVVNAWRDRLSTCVAERRARGESVSGDLDSDAVDGSTLPCTPRGAAGNAVATLSEDGSGATTDRVFALLGAVVPRGWSASTVISHCDPCMAMELLYVLFLYVSTDEDTSGVGAGDFGAAQPWCDAWAAFCSDVGACPSGGKSGVMNGAESSGGRVGGTVEHRRGSVRQVWDDIVAISAGGSGRQAGYTPDVLMLRAPKLNKKHGGYKVSVLCRVAMWATMLTAVAERPGGNRKGADGEAAREGGDTEGKGGGDEEASLRLGGGGAIRTAIHV